MVDTVLYFEGEARGALRLLRAVKNRFGSTHELGMFRMDDAGLQEVPDPSEVFLAERPQGVAGSVVVAGLEGTRPLLVEVQALVAPSALGVPRRVTTGVDYNRVCLLLAVLTKRVGLRVDSYDAFLKVTGGVQLDEPAADLGVAVALASSFRDVPALPSVVVVGEVGLGGEVRAVTGIAERVREAGRLGFSQVVLPSSNLREVPPGAVELVGVASVGEAVEAILRR